MIYLYVICCCFKKKLIKNVIEMQWNENHDLKIQKCHCLQQEKKLEMSYIITQLGHGSGSLVEVEYDR